MSPFRLLVGGWRPRLIWTLGVATAVFAVERTLDVTVRDHVGSSLLRIALDWTADSLMLAACFLIAIRLGWREHRRVEDIYRLLTESSTDLVFLLDRQLRVLYLNESAGRVLGQRLSDAIGRPLGELFPAEAAQRVGGALEHVLRTGETSTSAPQALGRSGLWVETTFVPIVDRGGETTAVLGRCRDVTAQHEAEERSFLLTQELSELVESSPIAHLVVDARNRLVTGCNRAFRDSIGWSLRQMPDLDSWWALACPDPAYREDVSRRWARELQAAEREGRDAGPLEVRVTCGDGATRVFEMRAPGRGELRLLTFNDLTGRVAAEQALRESERRFRSVVEHAREGIVLLDESGRVIEWNHAAEDILGVPATETLGRPVWEIERDLLGEAAESQPRRREQFRELLATGRGTWAGRVYEREHRRPDGSVCLVEERINLIRTARGFMAVGITTDVTARKRAERLLALERDLVGALSHTSDLDDAARLLLEAALRIEGVDAGGIFVRDPGPTGMRLLACQGVGEEFVAALPTIDTAVRARRVRSGERLFESWETLRHDPPFVREGLRSIAMLPIMDKGRIVATLCLGSHAEDALGDSVRAAAEVLLAHVGGTFVRIRAETELAESEEQLRATFEQAAVGLVHRTLDGRTVRVNQRYCEIVGRSREELIGETFFDYTHPDDRARDREVMRRISAREVATASWEKRYYRKDGTLVWVQVTVSLRLDADGQPLHFISVVEDITDRKRAELELERSRGLLQSVIDSALDAIVGVDDSGRVVVWNSAAEKMFGIRAEDAIGGPLDRFLPEGMRAEHARKLRSFASEDAPVQRNLRGFGVREGGAAFPVELSLSRAIVGGRALSTAIVRDVSERERAEGEQRRLEAALKHAAYEWRRTFDALESAVIIVDDSGAVVRLNRAAAAQLGREPSECLGLALGTVARGEPWRTAQSLLARAGEERAAFAQARDETAGRWWDLAATRFEDGSGVRFILLVRDATALVRLQESVRQAEQMAAMGSLTAGVAHEVRNPLFAISANVDALGMVLDGRADVAELLEAVRAEVKRVNALMVDLLEYGRAAVQETSEIPAAAAVELAIEFCGPLATAKRITVRRDGPPPDRTITAARERLAEAFENLLENAIEHSSEGSEVVVSAAGIEQELRPWVRFVIRDHGPGFRPEDLPHVFNPFFTRRKGGTGLGLSIAQKTVAQHGGRISADNAEGGGARLTVDLPCVERGSEERP